MAHNPVRQGHNGYPFTDAPRHLHETASNCDRPVRAFSLSIAQVNAEDRFLVDDGKAYAEIIISESPARSARLAAAELQTCVAKISGARLPIRVDPSIDVPVQIYVGESPHAALTEKGF